MMSKEKDCSWNASCTWGDGPDVLLVHKKNEKCRKSYDLTKEEAIQLANRLLVAASIAGNMDDSVEEYFQQEKRNDLMVAIGTVTEGEGE